MKPISIFLDTADLSVIRQYADNVLIKGFTTNPTLMKRYGVKDYEVYARTLLDMVGDKEVAFEVVSEDPEEIMRQALKIHGWGENVNVKIPYMDSKGGFNLEIISRLMMLGVHVNITAIISLHQVSHVLSHLPTGKAILSVFAGRLADTGEPPAHTMMQAVDKLKYHPSKRVLWASVREPVNIAEAGRAGCHIITVPPEMFDKAVKWNGKDLEKIAQETSAQFINDATSAGLTL